MRKLLLSSLFALALPFAAMADNDDDNDSKFGLAGVLSAKNKQDLEPIQLGAGIPLTSALGC